MISARFSILDSCFWTRAILSENSGNWTANESIDGRLLFNLFRFFAQAELALL